MDFLEQPHWITASGNAIDIGTSGPYGALYVGNGTDKNPYWLSRGNSGDVLASGSSGIGWQLPAVKSVNGISNAGASIYAPITPYNDEMGGEVPVNTGCSTGAPEWRAPLITNLNGQVWSSITNGFGIYAPNTYGNTGEVLVANGNGTAPLWAHHNKVYYGYCSTQDTTATKTIYLYDDDYVELKRGTILIVDFSYGSRPDTSSSSWQTNYGSLYLSVPTSSGGSRTNDLIEYRGNTLNRYVYSFGWDDAQCVTFVFNNNGRWEMIAGGSGYTASQAAQGISYKTDQVVAVPANNQYDKIITIMCRDVAQYGRIELHYGLSTNYHQIINSCENQHGYWQTMEMCLTAFVPGGYTGYIHTNSNLEGTFYYAVQYLFT